jgi:hypothetical protein
VGRLLGGSLVLEITPKVVKRYQADRLREKAGPKSINDEVQLLFRLCGEQGALIRATWNIGCPFRRINGNHDQV